MRGRIKLHNLGAGFFSDEFAGIRRDYDEKLRALAEEFRNGLELVKDSSKSDAEVVRAESNLKLQKLSRDLFFMGERIGELERKIKNSFDSLFGVLRVESDITSGRLKSQSLSLTTHANENIEKAMRQNVYLIELLRELFGDIEPKYFAKEKWYDHGWR